MTVYGIKWELNETGDIYLGVEETLYVDRNKAVEAMEVAKSSGQNNIQYWICEFELEGNL